MHTHGSAPVQRGRPPFAREQKESPVLTARDRFFEAARPPAVEAVLASNPLSPFQSFDNERVFLVDHRAVEILETCEQHLVFFV